MKPVCLLLFLLGISAGAYSQQQPVLISVGNMQANPTISIYNGYTLPVEAFLVTVETPATNRPVSRIYYDIHLNYRHDTTISPGASQQVPLPHALGQDLPVPTLRAVVFADGSTQGDAAWVDELLHMRKILAGRIEQVIGLLQNASNQKLTLQETLDIVRKAREASRNETPSATADERIRHEQAFYMAIRNLEHYQQRGGNASDSSRSLDHLTHVMTVWLSDLQAANPPLKPRAAGSN